MAITKLLRMKTAEHGNKAKHLKNNIFYICNKEKTSGGIYIGGNAGISPEMIYRTMLRNKQKWVKLNGTQGFHYVLSFSPETMINETFAFQFAEEFARELLGDEFYYMFAIHNDKDHLHIHLTFDSVSRIDGHKYHSPKGDWERKVQPITDRLCRKYQLPVLEKGKEAKGADYAEWKNRKENQDYDNRKRFNWYDIIRDDIDAAIAGSETFEQFIHWLEKEHYEVRIGKYISLKPEGRERAVRTGRLGEAYTKENLMKRLADKKYLSEPRRFVVYGSASKMRVFLHKKHRDDPKWQMTVFQKHFFARWHNTYFLRQPDLKLPAWKYRRDICQLEELANTLYYLVNHNIETYEQFVERKKWIEGNAAAQKEELSRKRNELHRKKPWCYLNRYRKLEHLYEKSFDYELLREMQELKRKVEKELPWRTALKQWELIKEEVKRKNDSYRELKKEETIVKNVERLYFGRPDITEELERKEREAKQREGRTERELSGGNKETGRYRGR